MMNTCTQCGKLFEPFFKDDELCFPCFQAPYDATFPPAEPPPPLLPQVSAALEALAAAVTTLQELGIGVYVDITYPPAPDESEAPDE